MNKIILTSSLILFQFSCALVAQNTVGLLSYDPVKTFEGYNLMFPHNQPNVYLLDNCGEVVHVWEDDANWRPGNTVYLTRDGLLYKAKRDVAVVGDRIWAGGGGAVLEIRDWDNNLIWDFEMNNAVNRLHHDFAVTPDGNVIALAWELKTAEECLAAGRDTSTLSQEELWPDWVFEINPDNDEIVWEWHTWDHLIQDFDSTKNNYGVIADHPELIDVNYGRVDGHPDWMHSNALDYNAELDQIMLSVPYFDELWIIDQTTSTAEAAGHFGGLSNRGGDLMYRWGNPITYQQGDLADQQLFFQHDAHWIDDFLEPGHPHIGKIALFNNRVAADYSSANVIAPPWDMYKWRYMPGANNFPPEDFDLILTHPELTALWSTGLSSVQFLPNGNTLITSGRFGYSFELTPSNEVVWEYKTPFNSGARATQGSSLQINNNLTFRMKRYPVEYSAFNGRDLSSKGWIELEPDSTFCDQLTKVIDLSDQSNFKVYPNPADDFIAIEWDGMMKADIEIQSVSGFVLQKFDKCSGGRKYLDTSSWLNGLYIIRINKQYSTKVLILQ